ncbi:hypothetical protein M4J06_000466 [Streptomyces coelicoflavus]|uniref:hypothetical protein n=1 Tax=Streptomyces coelicoflavus TaxID=285562 RepID=UPI00210DE2DA|nr:hypothetical protein [Streptomyces coelicoflavus]MCQ4203164.1 hypothetical protein [Streptomyces coelicoflavus]
MTASDAHVNAFAEIFGDPPADYAVPVDWAAVESWLGTSLPADYKAITAAYGPLGIGAWLWLHMPCVNRGWFDYGAWVQQTRRDAPGVLPFGATFPRRRHPRSVSTPGSGCTNGWALCPASTYG